MGKAISDFFATCAGIMFLAAVAFELYVVFQESVIGGALIVILLALLVLALNASGHWYKRFREIEIKLGRDSKGE